MNGPLAKVVHECLVADKLDFSKCALLSLVQDAISVSMSEISVVSITALCH